MENTSINDDGLTCLLESDDTQCGHIFLSESKRMLKFFCTLCSLTFDNINHFCNHIDDHLRESIVYEEPKGSHSPAASNIVNIEEDETNNSLTNIKHDEEDDDDMNMSFDSVEEGGYSDESGEIAAEVAQEMLALGNANVKTEAPSKSSGFYRNSVEQELKSTQEETTTRTYCTEKENSIVKTEQLDFENLIDLSAQCTATEGIPTAASSHDNTSTPLEKRKKNKKVVTVKVIASRNRIAELYAKVKLEEDKRCITTKELNVPLLHEREPPPAENFEEITSTDIVNESAAAEIISASNTSETNRQIIGDTLITLLPNAGKLVVRAAALSSTNTDDASDVPTAAVNRIKSLFCPACGKWFHSTYRLTQHKRSHFLESNNKIKLGYRCSDCDSLFNTITDMKIHQVSAHYADGFICKICGRKLTTLILLETHIRKVHLKRPFSCKICLKNYDNREVYEEHIRSHYMTTRTFRCHICGRKYSTDSMLKHHQNRHKERKPQCCVVCGKMTLRITQHMKVHEPRPKHTNSCSICGKKFNFSSGLTTHFRDYHKLLPEPKEKRRIRPKVTCNAVDAQTTVNAKSKQETEGPVTRSRQKYGFSELVKKQTILEQQQQQYDEEITHKEEEAKRVIVELVKNVTYSSFLPENFVSGDDEAPPMAREETITDINSTVHE